MKALLQKDLYQLRAYCKSYLLICAVFFGISLTGEGKPVFHHLSRHAVQSDSRDSANL